MSSSIKNTNKMLNLTSSSIEKAIWFVKEPDTNKVTYEDKKGTLILGTTAVFTVWWMFK